MGLLLCVIEASTSPIPHAIACPDDLSRTIREILSAGTSSLATAEKSALGQGLCDLFSADSDKLSDEGDAIRKWIGSDPMENEGVWKILNPIDNPPKTAVLLAHGKDDADVPISQSETYYRVMKAKDCDIQKLWLNGDHYSVIDVASDDWLVILNAIQDWL